MRVYVLADSQQQFSDWCARQRVNQAAAVCVLDPFSLMGKIEVDDQVVDLRLRKVTPTVQSTRNLVVFDEASEVHRQVWERAARQFEPDTVGARL